MGAGHIEQPKDSLLSRMEEGYGTLSSPPSHAILFETPPPGYLSHSISELWRRGYQQLPSSGSAPFSKTLSQFYDRQNALLCRYVHVMKSHPHPYLTRDDARFLNAYDDSMLEDDVEAAAEHDQRVQVAIGASNVCNAILLVAQLYVFITSGSLALLAVFLDAALDMVSSLVLAFTWHMKRKQDVYRYPVGRARLEPLGVISMACLMTAATLLTLEQSVAALAVSEDRPEFAGLTWLTGGILVFAWIVKFCLYQFCCRIDDASSKALAEDHFNDCMSNAVSFFTVLLAQHALWWVDPVGGIFISSLIIRNWLAHTLQHFDQLLGRAADKDTTGVLTFMACNHHEDIRNIDTVRAYHSGSGLYVEIDIVLDSHMPLSRAHDIAESLQSRIEKLPEVERCFVHSDTETSHSPKSEHKVV